MRKGFQISCLLSSLEEEGFFPGAAQDKVDLNAVFISGAVKPFEQTKGVNGAARTCNADDNSQMTSGLKSPFCSDSRTKNINFIESGTG